MASRSPGRRRIVIRSRAGPLLDGLGSKSGDCESSHARMAISASVDSDICRWAATAANKRFSCGVGRAVIDGAVDFKAPSFTARNPELLQNADTSLSCHHSNNDPATLLDPKSLLIRSANSDLYIARITECFGLEFRVFFQRNSPRVSATIGCGTYVNARLRRSPTKPSVCAHRSTRPHLWRRGRRPHLQWCCVIGVTS